MNRDVLERLLIDQAAGELSPDVEELLENHLREDAAARKEAAEISETFDLARLALASDPVIALPVRQLPRRVRGLAWSVAACLMCTGLILALAIADRNRRRIGTPAIEHQVASAPTEDESGFWSAYRARANGFAPRRNITNPVFWESPVRKPQILSK